MTDGVKGVRGGSLPRMGQRCDTGDIQQEDGIVFIAMNRFRIARGKEDVFEDLWRKRESYLDDVAGFREFHLLRGPVDDDAALYASHSVWDSSAAFEAWTNSEAFRKAHGQAKAPEGTYLGHPVFEGFEVVI